MSRDPMRVPDREPHPRPEPWVPRVPAPEDTGDPVTLAITGASGAVYGVRLLAALNDAGVPVRLVVSRTGWRLLAAELDIAGEDALRGATGDWGDVAVYDDDDRGATPASGSAPSRGMAICPCSMGTLASIAQGTTRSLIERAADVCLKERRRLVLVPRETPYSEIHLENMLRLTRAGVVVLPASPGFYHRPREIEELVEFVVARVLSQLGIEHGLGPRWSSGEGGSGGPDAG
ncbi:MAG: UbiX family flavin prenyltransferase [Longimicrobiales bacterium]